MSTKYILHPDGTIKKITDDSEVPALIATTRLASQVLRAMRGEGDGEKYASVVSKEINEERFVDSDNDNFYSYSIKNKDDLEGINGGFGYNSVSDNYDGPVKETSQNNSFGFLGGQENPKEYISFNTFLDKDDDDNKTIPYASEFEIVTGIRPATEYVQGSLEIFEEFSFVFEYLATVIVKVVAVEAIMFASQNRLFRDGFGVEQRRIYSFGEYDFTDYDVFTRYITEVLNYPKHKSNVEDRLLAYFVGLIEYLSTDNFFDLDSLLQNNVGFFNKDNYFVVLLNYTINLTLSSISTEQGKKKLLLLTKKFNTQQYWLENNLYPHKKQYRFDDIINPFNYYHFKFIIERINVGLKIINRKILRNQSQRQKEKISQENRVSGFRTKDLNENITYTISTKDLTSTTAAQGILGLKNEVSRFIKTSVANISTFIYTPALNHIDNLISFYKSDVSKVDYNWDINKANIRESSGLNLTKIPQAFLYNDNIEKVLVLNNNDNDFLKGGEELLQNFVNVKERKRIPIGLINEIEKSLELEYVPFYFHDIRTNEIISLNAFVESVSDSYSPEYSSSGGFGRIDDVKTYVKTTRNVSLSFFIAALSPEDHDLMWYQINKLVSMVYPQWSKGFEISKGSGEKFTYPFSQVITSSPLIRIRLGDVITSNYSKTNLSRIFGSEINLESQQIETSEEEEYYLMPGEYSYIDSFFISNQEKIFVNNQQIKITNAQKLEKDIKDKKDVLEVEIETIGESNTHLLVSKDFIIKKVKKRTKDNIEEKRKFKNKLMNSMDFGFINNPFTAAYESGMSKGLAGHITNLDLNYQDMTWETSKIGSKAPMIAKINITFSPIHDIPPGLDHTGMMRAPHYNVGSLNNSMFGDPLDREYTGEFKENVMNKYTESLKKVNK
jgi:hypothetical protein